MELFKLIDVLFKDPKKYRELTNNDKKKNFFMINRRMGIAFPIQANGFNRIGVNPAAVIDMWQKVASRNGKVPSWMYTKTTTQKKTKKWEAPPEVVDEYLRINNIGKRELEDAMKLDPEGITKYLKIIDKTISANKI